VSRLGVLVMAYGGPDSLADVEPYLLDIRGGRPTAPALVEEIRERYRRIGGKSPLREITEQQAEALRTALAARGVAADVTVGMRHWQPRIAAAVQHMTGLGVTHAVGLAMAPHYSRRSVGAYQEQVRAAASGTTGAPPFSFVSHFGDHPRFTAAVAREVRAALHALAEASEAAPGAPPFRVLFSAHSLPEAWVDGGDPYPGQLRASAAAAAAAAGLQPDQWRQCYQSAGARPGAWLGPALEDEVRLAAADGIGHVVVAPFGFVADHVEILFDIDIELRELGDSLGVRVSRTRSLGTDPELMAALADRVLESAASGAGNAD
jgi:ferrochelatase